MSETEDNNRLAEWIRELGSESYGDKEVIVMIRDPFEFGGFLKEYRTTRGMNLQQLSRLTGVSANALRFWETRERIPSMNSVYHVLKRMGVTKVIIDIRKDET